jgi:hypothetical protein
LPLLLQRDGVWTSSSMELSDCSRRVGGGSVIFQKSAFLGNTFMQLVEFCLDQLNTEDMGLMVVLSCGIWLRRNKLIFESIFTHP